MTGRTFQSLRIRNYRLFFIGQFVSVTGTWMQTVAQGWLVLRLSGSSGVALGTVVALQFLPMLVLGPWGGVVADRFDKRRTLVGAQAWMALAAATLAVLDLTGVVQLWHVYLLSSLTGLGNVVDVPTRQAFVTELVGSDDLPNAVGLNSAMFNGARVFGPAMAGPLIALFSTGVCFAVNAFSFVAVIGALCCLRTDDLFRSQLGVGRAKGQVLAGIRYVRSEPVLRTTLILVAIVGTFAMNFQVLLPLMAKRVFGGDAGTYGLITAFMGGGAMVGALVTASSGKPSQRRLIGASLAFGVTMLVGSVAPTLLTETAVLVLVGAASITFLATANTTVQLASAPEMRGRVMALYALVFLGSTPFGGPVMGWLAQHAGTRFAMGVGASSCFVAAGLGAWLLRRVQVAALSDGPSTLALATAGTDPAVNSAAA